MNLVGIRGKGESVWLGFFSTQCSGNLPRWRRRAAKAVFAERCRKQAVQTENQLGTTRLGRSLVRRAYFDDGAPLGSATNTECRSIRSHRAGAFCPGPATLRARKPPWRRWTNAWCGGIGVSTVIESTVR